MLHALVAIEKRKDFNRRLNCSVVNVLFFKQSGRVPCCRTGAGEGPSVTVCHNGVPHPANYSIFCTGMDTPTRTVCWPMTIDAQRAGLWPAQLALQSSQCWHGTDIRTGKVTRGQSNLTKSASRGAHSRLGVTPGGRKLYHWIPGVGFPISVP